MSKFIPGNHKHLSLSDRIYIESSLNNDISISEIAKYLCKDPTTISREILKHREHQNSLIHSVHNMCAKINDCNKKNVCNMTKPCVKHCRNCNLCNRHCADFTPSPCYKHTHRAPHVCNGCPNKRGCKMEKYYYRAEIANDNYQSSLSNCRAGVNSSPEEMENLNAIVSPAILKGQSINHIFWSNIKDINCSRSTLYRYIDQCTLDVRNIDLTRKVKYKKRRKNPYISPEAVLAARTNRTYEDFKKYIDDKEISIVEMDTVLGTINSNKCLLTLYFRSCKLMLAFILDQHTSDCVCNAIDYLELKLGYDLFRKLFGVILTDNGIEFSDPDYIEQSADGTKRTKVFYCNPSAPNQKGGIEKNHEFIRYVLPKKTSFDSLSQKDINLMINNINSYRRASLNKHTPFEVAQMFMPKEFFKTLNLKKIKDTDVILKPSLLKK